MDWTLRAAKKKTNAIPGGSRSIIESLNALNNICDEGQEAINNILKGFDALPHSAVGRSLANSNTVSSMSPEKTIATKSLMTTSVVDTHSTEVLNTPKSEKQDMVPNMTPRSASEEKEVEKPSELKTTINLQSREPLSMQSPSRHMVSHESSVKKTNDRQSSWSPFKADRSLQNISTHSIDNHMIHETNTVSMKTSVDKTRNEKKLQFTTDEKVTSNNSRTTKPLSESERVLRKKSNMFIPLPSKETFVMKSSPGERENRAEKILASKNEDKEQKELHKDKLKDQNRPSEQHSNEHKVEVIIDDHNMHPKSTSNSHTSVFERLSTIPTKSFQKKISKQALEKHSSTPNHNRRMSNGNFRIDRKSIAKSTFDTSMQDTLRDIFESSQKTSSVKKDHVLAKPKHDESKLVQQRKSLLPVMRRSSLASSISAIKISNNDQTIKKTETELTSQNKTRDTSVIKEGVSTKITPLKPISSSIISPTKSSILKSVQRGSPKRVDKSPVVQSVKSKVQTKHDRLTNFHLMPTLESKKTELKKKLNKRLSEVMRTQFEQQRKKTKQKRKSQINEEVKRGKKTINEAKENSFNVSEIPSDGSNFVRYHEKGQRYHDASADGRRLLDTIDTVDHRVFIGENDEKEKNIDPNCTLPEITSDSEAEETQVLASWAEPANLEKCMLNQKYIDPIDIFGPVHPLKPEEIFRASRTSNIKSKN